MSHMRQTNSTHAQLSQTNGIIFAGIVLPGLVINTMAVIITSNVARKQMVPPNVFLAALATLDLTSILLTTTPTTVYYIHGEWGGGRAVCKYQGIMSIFSTMSMGSIAALIAIDRYIATLRPLWYYAHSRDCTGLKIILCALVFALLFSLLPLTGLGEINTQYPGTFCSLTYSPQSSLATGYALGVTVVCLLEGVVVVVCNLSVCLSVCRYRHRIQPMLGQMFSMISARRRRESQYSRTMLAVSLLFLACWVPFMIRALCDLSGAVVVPEFGAWIVRLLILKYTLDPCTYLLTRKQYRDAFTSLITCRHCIKSRDVVISGHVHQHALRSDSAVTSRLRRGHHHETLEL